METSAQTRAGQPPAAIQALAAIAGLLGLQMMLQLLLRLSFVFTETTPPWSGSMVLFSLRLTASVVLPDMLNRLIDLLGVAACAYLAYGLIKLRSRAWYLAMVCAGGMIAGHLMAHAIRAWQLYALKSVPAPWRDAPAPFAQQMTSLANLPRDILPILAQLLVWTGIALYLFEKRALFGIGVAKPRWMQSHPWEILCLSVGSGLVATEQIYSLLYTRVTQGSVHGASFLSHPLPAPLDVFLLLGSIAVMVYLAYGLHALTRKALPLAWICLGYLALSQVVWAIRVLPQASGSAADPLGVWHGVAQNIIMSLPAILVHVTVGLYLLEAKERFSR